MIGLINYGIGNIRSVANALTWIQADFEVATDASESSHYDHLILPGVGAFASCASMLSSSGFDKVVLEHAGRGKPLLGICVGMQLLADDGTEFGVTAGLGLVPGTVEQIPRSSDNLRLPHIGWNALQLERECPLLAGLGDDTAAYFIHSFHFRPTSSTDVSATIDYGGPVTAAVSRGAVYGLQFHPEKSQSVGLTILRNFAKL
ncbi:MAG: imidazole glycerol phosphate synthase subunit HisH [Hyphomicrobiaceae bacterium]